MGKVANSGFFAQELLPDFPIIFLIKKMQLISDNIFIVLIRFLNFPVISV